MHSLVHFSPAARALNSFFNHLHFAGDTHAQIAVDVVETPDAYTLRANVPGVAKDDVAVSIDRNTVKLEVEFKSDMGDELVWRERATGKLSRTLRLAHPIDGDAASAKQEHGVLTLTLPKKSETHVKRVTIQ